MNKRTNNKRYAIDRLLLLLLLLLRSVFRCFYYCLFWLSGSLALFWLDFALFITDEDGESYAAARQPVSLLVKKQSPTSHHHTTRSAVINTFGMPTSIHPSSIHPSIPCFPPFKNQTSLLLLVAPLSLSAVPCRAVSHQKSIRAGRSRPWRRGTWRSRSSRTSRRSPRASGRPASPAW